MGEGVLPSLSATEREAIEAGDVWWDAEISPAVRIGRKLLAVPQAALSAENKPTLMDGRELCRKARTMAHLLGAARPAAGHLGLAQRRKNSSP